MSSPIHVFVGPRKTGTSWLHHVCAEDLGTKEIRYPSRFGRDSVYRRHVSGKRLLIWPYLVHEPACLDALLDDIDADARPVRLYYSIRDEASWTDSMSRFLTKYGMSRQRARSRAARDRLAVEAVASRLERTRGLKRVRIIDPSRTDLHTLAEACGVSIERLEAARGQRVYETDESSRIPSAFIVELFFRLKPFLPVSWHRVTRIGALRKLFFRRRGIGR